VSIVNIVQWPDKGLTTLCTKLTDEQISSDFARDLAEDLIDTCEAVGGLGLAANQIGVNVQMAVVNLDHLLTPQSGDELPGYLIMINPVVVLAEGEQMLQEGCLSIPRESVVVKRPAMVSVEYTDLNGERHSIGGQGLMAVALLHEIDHINGRTYVDSLPRFKRSIIRKRALRLKKKLRQAGFNRIPVMALPGEPNVESP
jgi:peptide deformylase